MNPWWLMVIVPVCAGLGALCACLAAASGARSRAEERWKARAEREANGGGRSWGDLIRSLPNAALAEFIAGIYTNEADAWGDGDRCIVVFGRWLHLERLDEIRAWLEEPAGGDDPWP